MEPTPPVVTWAAQQPKRQQSLRLILKLDMVETIDSLSLESAAAIIAAISVGLAFIWVRIRHKIWRRFASLAAPFALSYSLYWTPVWFGHGDRASFAAWAPLFILPWFAAGAAATVLTVFLIGKIRRKPGNTTTSNQSSDPTLSSVTPPAVQESRPR